jgi:flagellar hook-basal body complex protein FliE
MVASLLDAVSAYRKATALPQELQPISGAGKAAGSSFGEIMEQVASDTVQQLNKAESITQQGVLGKASPVEIATAVAGAETSLQTLSVLREKIVSAYQEMARMSV